MRILIIEDHVLTLTNLKEGLNAKGYSETACARNEIEATELFHAFQPDLVLMDINLGTVDVSGIDLAMEFNRVRSTPIIFITGEISPLIVGKAIKARPANYLVKPINLDQLAANMELALVNYTNNQLPNIEERKTIPKLSVDTILQKDDALYVRAKNRFEKKRISDILWVQADNIYTDVYSESGRQTLSMSLKRFEEQVNAANLIKVNRSQIINLDHVDSFEAHRAFIGQQEFRVTEKFKPQFFQSFGA